MPEQANGGGGIQINLEGSHLRVDARPARLVSQLLGSGNDPIVTAHAVDGAAHTQSLPGQARQATFRIRDDVTVEATRAADFVAIAEDSGRCLVVALRGEVTVLPRGNDRFALGAHEALVVPAGEGDPRVVATDSLTDSDRAEVDAVLDATVDAVFAEPEPQAEPEPPAEPEPQPVKAATATAPAAAPVKKAGQATRGAPSKAAGQRRKGKKGRPQPGRGPQKSAGAKKASPAAKAAAAPVAAKAAAGGGTPPKPPSKGGGGGGGGGGRGDDSYEDTPSDRRLMIGLVLGALAIVVVLILVLSGGDDGDQQVATEDATTTTEAADATTTTPADATTTTGAPDTTTTAAPATTTTARAATTTTARATTTTAAPAPQPSYSIEPKSCVQNGSSVTYTAAITNNASVAFDFTVTVVLKDSNGKEIGTAEGSVTNLASKRTADFSATARNVSGTPAACDVSRVQADPS